MIELEQAAKRFRITPGPGRDARTVVALRDFTLSIPAGSSLGVVGPNGAGKSTLFALILGFLKPTAGRVAIEGVAPRDYVRRNGAAYLPERFRLPPDWRVRDALTALARLEKIAAPVERATHLLEQLGLEEHAGKAVGTLSRGLLQRLGIAQALLAPRALVVLDEPTEGLDPFWRLRLRDIIRTLRAEQRTLLIASHDLSEIERSVDRAVLLADGTIREMMTVAVAADQPRRFRIELREPTDVLHELFPDSTLSDGGRSFTTVVSDTRDLSARLAALLDRGAAIEAVVPLDGLEERVRSALEPRT